MEGVSQSGAEEGAAFLESGEVFSLIVGDPVAPANEHDALPLKGEGAHRAGVTLAARDLLLEEEFGPRAVEGGLAGILEEALVDEVWATITAVDPMLVLAAFFL